MTLQQIGSGLLSLIALPILVVGVINRTKARWAGRRGLPLVQLAFIVIRLLRKQSVFSSTTTPIFRIAPYVVLVTSVLSGLVVPMFGRHGTLSFPFDFVWFAYVWGLGRVALMLSALDTGSSFEGMGASREATFSALLEPALFLVAGALCGATGKHSLEGALALRFTGGGAYVVWLGSIVALFIIIQVESSRMPVDDPDTHLELTMIHEVMILDHSGPELAALHLGSAIKMTVGIAMISTLMNPFTVAGGPVLAATTNTMLCLFIATVIGTVESLVARLKMSRVPQYVLGAIVAASVALLATSWRAGGA